MLNIIAYKYELEELLKNHSLTEAVRAITKEDLGISECVEWLAKVYTPLLLTPKERFFLAEELKKTNSVFAIAKCATITKGMPQSYYLSLKRINKPGIIIPFESKDMAFEGLYLYKWYSLSELNLINFNKGE